MQGLTDYHPSDSRKVVGRLTEIEHKVEGDGKAMVRKWGERENTGTKRDHPKCERVRGGVGS